MGALALRDVRAALRDGVHVPLFAQQRDGAPGRIAADAEHPDQVFLAGQYLAHGQFTGFDLASQPRGDLLVWRFLATRFYCGRRFWHRITVEASRRAGECGYVPGRSGTLAGRG